VKAQIPQKLLDKSIRARKVFTTPDGQKMLEVLHQEFNGPNLYVEDSDRTEFNLGRRDVVMYIEQLINLAKESTK
jgi:hypothetical protein